ncbi:MAG: hypothetical protein U0V70_13195 [Terriglobia bacterium]
MSFKVTHPFAKGQRRHQRDSTFKGRDTYFHIDAMGSNLGIGRRFYPAAQSPARIRVLTADLLEVVNIREQTLIIDRGVPWG